MRKVDKYVFDAVKSGEKTVETRAATDSFRRIEVGDILVFSCDGEKFEKEIKNIKIFRSVDEMVGKIDFKKVMPFISSVDEMKKVYDSFPGYRDKIKKLGLIAFELK